MRALSITLFVVGVLVSLTSFAAAHATSIPFVLRLFAPTYYGASLGRQQLEETRKLQPDDAGFRATAEIMMNHLKKLNPEKPQGVFITRMSLGSAALHFSTARVGEQVPLDVQLSTGETVPVDVSLLDQLISAHKEAGTFRYAFIAFVVGTLAETIAFLLEFFRRHPVSSREPS